MTKAKNASAGCDHAGHGHGDHHHDHHDHGMTVRDPVSGTAYRESINADGGGLRCGLSWGF